MYCFRLVALISSCPWAFSSRVPTIKKSRPVSGHTINRSSEATTSNAAVQTVTLTSRAEEVEAKGQRRTVQEKRRRNRTLTFGARQVRKERKGRTGACAFCLMLACLSAQVFLPPPSDPPRSAKVDANENLSGTSGSDPGICLNFGSSEEVGLNFRPLE